MVVEVVLHVGRHVFPGYVVPTEGRIDVVNTDVHTAVNTTSKTAQYDASAKRIMSNRSILGNFLARVLPPLKGMDPRDVENLISPEVHIGTIPVDPGLTNMEIVVNGERVVGFNTERKEIHEGEVHFDLICYVQMPDGLAEVIVNIELQKERPSGYPVPNRGLYYVCREISSQKERDFKGKNYDKIKNTYSVWIVMNEKECSLCHYHLAEDRLMGSVDWNANLDMLHVIVVGITNELPAASEEYELHRFLSAIYSSNMSSKERLDVLNREYDIPITTELDEEVNEMCNLGEGIEERALAKGMEQGVEAGQQMATEAHVVSMHNKGKSDSEIADLLELDIIAVHGILVQKGLTTD